MKILMRNAVRPIQSAIVMVAILAVMVGSSSLGVRAQDAAQGDLTTLSDSEIVAYRWQAMGRYYAAVPTPVNLTTLSDSEIVAYRWQAMGRYYAAAPTPVNLTTMSDSEIVAFRWQAMGRYYAAAPTPVNLTTLSDSEIVAYRWQAMSRYYKDGTARIALPTPTADVLRGVAAAQPSLGAAMVTVNSDIRSGQYAAPAQRTDALEGSRPVADVLGMARTAFGSLSTLADSIVAVFRLPQ